MKAYRPLFTQHPATRQERWDRLADFAAFWHGADCRSVDLTTARLDAEAKLGVALPAALIEWHARFGQFFNQWSDRACTLPIDRLRIDEGLLVVRTEPVFFGRHEVKWGIPVEDLNSEDPEIYSVLGDRCYECADSVSAFAIYCGLFDTVNSRHFDNVACDNDAPFPLDGFKAKFPDSFGIIKTMMYEGPNWLALTSGPDWYVRRRDIETGEDHFIKHEIRD